MYNDLEVANPRSGSSSTILSIVESAFRNVGFGVVEKTGVRKKSLLEQRRELTTN